MRLFEHILVSELELSAEYLKKALAIDPKNVKAQNLLKAVEAK